MRKAPSGLSREVSRSLPRAARFRHHHQVVPKPAGRARHPNATPHAAIGLLESINFVRNTSPIARSRVERWIETPGVKPVETAKSADSSEPMNKPPFFTKFCKFISPVQPSPGRMSSVDAKPPRLGVSSVFFHGRALPYIGRPCMTALA